MKTRSFIFSIAVLIAFSFVSLSFAQVKPLDKSKTITKTERQIKDSKMKKLTGHKSTLETTDKKEVEKAKMITEKMVRSNDKNKNENKEMMKNKSNMKYKGEKLSKTETKKDNENKKVK